MWLLSLLRTQVGRTARAGCGGRAITLVADNRRAVMKEVLKGETAAAMQQQSGAAKVERQVLSRTVPAAVVAYFTEQVQRLEPEIGEQMRREREQRKLDTLERDADRAANLLQHEDEIHARPARTWHETETQKKHRREQSRALAAEERQLAAGGGAAAQQRKKEQQQQAPLSAQQQAVAFAARDEYPLQRKELGTASAHRLTRKKRRRQEAMQEIAAEEQQQREQQEQQTKKICESYKTLIVIPILCCIYITIMCVSFLLQRWRLCRSARR